jgi:F-type H+-transporting ATPase subunit delta
MAGTIDDVGASYANALVDLAQEKGVLDAVHADVDTLAGIFKENDEVRDFLFNPVISPDNKKEVLGKLAKEASLSDYTLNFLSILVDQDRLVAADLIFGAFEKRYCELTDTQVATIYSAVKLEQEQQFLVAKKLQELTGSKNIKLKTVIDESLIAGFVVDYGSAQIDLSVKGQLEEVAQELVLAQAQFA